MFEFILAGGFLMLPILICSVIGVAIIFERAWALRRSQVVPQALVAQVRELVRQGRLNDDKPQALTGRGSALGRLFSLCFTHQKLSRESLQELLEEAGRHVNHELERYLSTLGTIAEIAPLLGLLGTVIGMIRVFFQITEAGVGDPNLLAGGISEALMTTATGLSVAIPAVVGYRWLRRMVESRMLELEYETARFVDALYGQKLRPGGSDLDD